MLRGGYIMYADRGGSYYIENSLYGVSNETNSQRITMHLAFGVPLLVTGILLVLRENE